MEQETRNELLQEIDEQRAELHAQRYRIETLQRLVVSLRKEVDFYKQTRRAA